MYSEVTSPKGHIMLAAFDNADMPAPDQELMQSDLNDVQLISPNNLTSIQS